MFCTNCGAPNQDGTSFCVNCGNKIGQNQPQEQPATAIINNTHSQNVNYIKEADTPELPVTLGDWMLTLLIFSIPVVGFIMMLIWAFDGNVKKSKANLCKASLLWSLICIIPFIFILIIIIPLIVNELSYYTGSYF